MNPGESCDGFYVTLLLLAHEISQFFHQRQRQG